MKHLGFVVLRNNGRFTIPMEIRLTMSLNNYSSFGIFLKDRKIYLKPHKENEVVKGEFLRKIDMYDRTTLPISICRFLNLKANDRLKYFVDEEEDCIVLEPIKSKSSELDVLHESLLSMAIKSMVLKQEEKENFIESLEKLIIEEKVRKER